MKVRASSQQACLSASAVTYMFHAPIVERVLNLKPATHLYSEAVGTPLTDFYMPDSCLLLQYDAAF